MAAPTLTAILSACARSGESEMYWVIEGLDESMRDKEYIMKNSLVQLIDLC